MTKRMAGLAGWRVLVPLMAAAMLLLSGGAGWAAAEGDHGHAAHPELPNYLTVLLATEVGGTRIGDTHFGHFVHTFEKQILLVTILVLLLLFVWWASRQKALIPGKRQAAVELLAETMYGFYTDILGKQGAKHVPFLGSLFLFIIACNLSGIVPGLGAPTSVFQTTSALALIVAVYVEVFAWRENGIKGYLFHAFGSPRSIPQWVLCPLFFMLHWVETLARPLSLALRLFGNIMGKDILIGVFMLMGISMMGALLKAVAGAESAIVGIPLQFPVYFLALLLSVIQAIVFTLLTAIYISLYQHHHDSDDGHEEHGHGEPAAAH